MCNADINALTKKSPARFGRTGVKSVTSDFVTLHYIQCVLDMIVDYAGSRLGPGLRPVHDFL